MRKHHKVCDRLVVCVDVCLFVQNLCWIIVRITIAFLIVSGGLWRSERESFYLTFFAVSCVVNYIRTTTLRNFCNLIHSTNTHAITKFYIRWSLLSLANDYSLSCVSLSYRLMQVQCYIPLLLTPFSLGISKHSNMKIN